MINNKTWMTAQTPSGFAMPTSGCRLSAPVIGHDRPARTVCTAPTYVVRDRHVAGVALAQATRSRVPPPGVHRPVDTNSIGNLQAADPKPGIRGLSVSRSTPAIRSSRR